MPSKISYEMLPQGAPLLLKEPTLNLEEMETLCDLNYEPGKNPTPERIKAATLAKERKKAIATQLAGMYEKGSDKTTPDPWKVHDYKKIAGLPSEHPGNSFIRDNTFNNYHAWWFTGIRLVLSRVGRVLTGLGRTFLPFFFGFFGLSYGITLAMNLAVIFKATFLPKPTPYELEMKYGFWKRTWLRFKSSVQKGNTPYNLMNDAIWFTVNLITLCLAGPLYLLLNPILNLIGFSFDAGHEGFWLGRETQKYQRLINKFTKQINNIEKELQYNPDDKHLHVESEKFKLMRDSVIAKRNEIFRRKVWITFWTIVILIGMVLVYFPPTALPGAFLIGAGLALAAGSVFTGLGRRLFLITEDFIKKIWRSQKSTTSQAVTNELELKQTSTTAATIAQLSKENTDAVKLEALPPISKSTSSLIALEPSQATTPSPTSTVSLSASASVSPTFNSDGLPPISRSTDSLIPLDKDQAKTPSPDPSNSNMKRSRSRSFLSYYDQPAFQQLPKPRRHTRTPSLPCISDLPTHESRALMV